MCTCVSNRWLKNRIERRRIERGIAVMPLVIVTIETPFCTPGVYTENISITRISRSRAGLLARLTALRDEQPPHDNFSLLLLTICPGLFLAFEYSFQTIHSRFPFSLIRTTPLSCAAFGRTLFRGGKVGHQHFRLPPIAACPAVLAEVWMPAARGSARPRP